MEVIKSFFDSIDGHDVFKYTLINDKKTRISILSYGGIWQEFVVNENGKEVPLILGLKNISDYEQMGYYIGQTIGRVAGRITNGEFVIKKKKYKVDMNRDGFSIHGGYHGFNKINFDGKLSEKSTISSVTLSKHISSIEDNYPGNLDVQITFSLDNDNTVSIEFKGISDGDTLFNPTNHTYWNTTDNWENLNDQWLQINSNRRLDCDSRKLPTGDKLMLEGTPYNFKSPKKLRDVLDELKFKYQRDGIDDTYEVFPQISSPIASIGDTNNLRRIDIYSDRNGLVVFTAHPTRKGKSYENNFVALEAQTLPDAINHSNFGDNTMIEANKASMSHIYYQYKSLK
jgi:aldose 1-epimerase